ncbi:MAG: glucosylceramidase, partial [Phycisphaerae bacterium]|nr:glucosylceramidase [Phycisphaerae bacterium]
MRCPMTYLVWMVLIVTGGWSVCRAEGPAEAYPRTILAEPGLVGYWRFEGDLIDTKTRKGGALHGEGARYVTGPVGKALVLDKGQFVTVEKTPELDVPETTVELLFKLTVKPDCNACLIAKRGEADNKVTRYSLHLSQDLTALLIWNGSAVLRADFPESPLKVGRWYHLAVAATAQGMDVFLDGAEAASIRGGSFTFSQKDLPLRIGAADGRGYEQCPCEIDEVAIHGRALTEADVIRHVEALGWAERRQAILAKKEALRKERLSRLEARRKRQMEVLAKRMKDPRLLDRGETRVYRGENLTGIRLPLGGIGAGCIQMNGNAELAIWQIFNNFQGAFVPRSFLAVRAKTAGGAAIVRGLQTSPVGPFEPMADVRFRGEYPFGWYDFEDGALPVAVSMEVFSPLIPQNAKDSAIPCAIFNITVKNTSDKPVEAALLSSQQNAVGFTGKDKIEGRRCGEYGGNRNRLLRQEGATVLHMTSDGPKTAPGHGDMALAVMAEEVTGATGWHDLDSLHKDFVDDGALAGGETAGPSPGGETLDGALAAGVSLKPGESKTVSFVLAWHFPNGRHGTKEWAGEGNMYANWWTSALDVAGDVCKRMASLTGQTRLYHDTLYASNLPYWLLDRISSQVAVLRSKTCFWSQDDFFGGWEGCCPGAGCCYGNCAHVWHYAQAHARLFPSIARRMRQQALRYQQTDGGIPFRLPKHGQACDGQCGEVLEAYREHLTSSDSHWLEVHWPRIKKAMDHVINRWDADQDGVLGGVQHNTLDCDLGGSSSWLGTLYLAALRAAARMADLAGYGSAAEQYRRIAESGCKKQDETLFNGEYYIQIPESIPHRDYNDGCHIDQVLGQWWAHQLDLGWLYPPDRVRSALRALLKNNFQDNFHGVPQRPRKFVHDDDAGMQMITWPKDDRPANHMLYADEVMTGFEYSAAVAMVQAGMIEEGFLVARAVADRYDGRERTGLTGADTASWGYSGNPFGDDECGKYYARAMSIWSMLTACQGFVHDGPAGVIGFAPVWRAEDHVSFFTAAEGWGL